MIYKACNVPTISPFRVSLKVCLSDKAHTLANSYFAHSHTQFDCLHSLSCYSFAVDCTVSLLSRLPFLDCPTYKQKERERDNTFAHTYTNRVSLVLPHSFIHSRLSAWVFALYAVLTVDNSLAHVLFDVRSSMFEHTHTHTRTTSSHTLPTSLSSALPFYTAPSLLLPLPLRPSFSQRATSSCCVRCLWLLRPCYKASDAGKQTHHEREGEPERERKTRERLWGREREQVQSGQL